MPRDPSGNFSLYTPGNPVVPSTTITSAWWNNTGTDLASGLTDSLSRSCLGGMLAPFKLVDGSAAAPAFSFQSESNTGIYRSAAGDIRFSVGNSDVFQWTATGVHAYVTFSATGAAPNGRGATFLATGSEQGVVGTGGSGAGNAGAWGIAGGASGFGTIGQGVSGGVGVYAYSSSTSVDAARVDGYVDLSHAANPAVNAGFTSRVTPKNIIKAWAKCHTDGAGNVTAQDGFNIASASIATSTLTLTFVTALANTNYCVVVSAFAPGSGASGIKFGAATSQSTGSVNVACLDTVGIINLAALSVDLHVLILGAQ